MIERNKMYGGLNRRFDKRAKRLASLGFKYKIIYPGVAAFIIESPWRVKVITAATVLNACNMVFWDEIRQSAVKVAA